MKKLFAFTFFVCATLLVCRAQVYLLQEGFENGIPSTWGNFDADGDGHVWVAHQWGDGFGPHSGNYSVTSASYDDEDGALTPNNYLVTPAVTIPAGLTISNNIMLRWWVAAQDGNFPADHYDVYVSTTGNSVEDFVDDAVFVETLYTSEWIQHSVDLSPYIGQTIYIAFVHNDCVDEFFMKLDDIEVMYFTEPTVLCGADEFDFGEIRVGEQSESKALTVISALLEDHINISVMPPFEVSPCGADYTQHISIPANSPSTIFVRYNPTSAGTDIGSVVFVSGDLSVSVALRGTGISCDALQLPFNEDFEEEISLCWTNSDFDEDGMTWMWENDGYGHESNGYYLSLSYDTEEWVDIMPNDWLITPQLAIPANGAVLSWWAAAYVDEWPDNTYDVLISTEGTGPGDFYSIYSETVTSETYRQSILDLSAYANQNIYIAFAHHTNTEETADSYGLVIDDIKVEAITGVHEIETDGDVLLYPNPVRDVLNISSVKGCDIMIVNMLGQILYRDAATDDEIQIDMQSFASGTYFVQVKGGKNCVKRFVVR